MTELVARAERGDGVRPQASGEDQLRLVECMGPSAVAQTRGWLDQLHAETGVSALARRGWLEAWTAAFTDWEAWVLVLLAGSEPLGVAPLARRRTPWGTEVVAIGDRALNDSPLAAREEAVAALAISLADALVALGGRWTCRLPQQPVGSPLTAAIRGELRVTEVFAGSPRPVLDVAAGAGRRWLTPNTAAALAKARNRIAREGHELTVEWVTPWDRIQALLPELVAVHRARDLELRGGTLLDEPDEADFYHQVLGRHAGRWQLLAVWIDGALAGYAMCLRDGDTLLVWDNRVSPRWRRYSAGLIANAEVVLRAAGDPLVNRVDWGCGLQRYKVSMSSELIEAQNLVAWSSPWVRAALAGRGRLASVARLARRGDRPS